MEASLRLAKYLESLQSLPGQLAGNYDDIRRLDTEAQAKLDEVKHLSERHILVVKARRERERVEQERQRLEDEKIAAARRERLRKAREERKEATRKAMLNRRVSSRLGPSTPAPSKKRKRSFKDKAKSAPRPKWSGEPGLTAREQRARLRQEMIAAEEAKAAAMATSSEEENESDEEDDKKQSKMSDDDDSKEDGAVVKKDKEGASVDKGQPEGDENKKGDKEQEDEIEVNVDVKVELTVADDGSIAAGLDVTTQPYDETAADQSIKETLATCSKLVGKKVTLALNSREMLDVAIRRLDTGLKAMDAKLKHGMPDVSSTAVNLRRRKRKDAREDVVSTPREPETGDDRMLAEEVTQELYRALQQIGVKQVRTVLSKDEPVYCVCQTVSQGEMVGCDNEKCPREWFHFACVGLSGQPSGKWFCDECQQKQERGRRRK